MGETATAQDAVLDHLGVGVLVFDSAHGLCRMNAAAERLLGATLDAARHCAPGGAPWRLANMAGLPFPADDHPVNRVFATGTARHGDMVSVRPADGGDPGWLRLDCVPEGAGPDRVVVTVADITEEYEALRHYRRSRDNTAEILENAPAAVCLTDAHGTFTYVNRAYTRLYGYAEGDLVGENFTKVVPPENRPALQAAHDAFIAGQREIRGEWDVQDARGERHTILADAVRLFDGDGRPCKATFIQDITERHRLERELERSNTELEGFAYAVSHDLQEPLRMVANYGDLLRHRYGDRLDARGRTYLDAMESAAGRMRRMIQGLLEYARVTTRGDTFAAVPLDTVVDDALADLETILTESGGRVSVDRPLPAVHGDASQLARLFQNLVNNAVKYRHPDRPPRIHIGARAAGAEWWTITVADNGRGLPDDTAHDIFQVFSRAHPDSGQADGEGGSGIGLAVCRRIVERHGGRIGATGTPDAGSTFTLTLPAAGS